MLTLADAIPGLRVHVDRKVDRFPFTTLEEGTVLEDLNHYKDRVLVQMVSPHLKMSGYILLEHLTALQPNSGE